MRRLGMSFTHGAVACLAATLAIGCTGLLGAEGRDGDSERSRAAGDGASEVGAGEGTLLGPNGEVIAYEPASTPLARLTNGEFFSSAVDALQIPADSPGLAEARASFAAEALVDGLPNDVKVQLLNQLAVAGYTNLATVAAEAFLSGASSQEELRQRLGCESPETQFTSCMIEFGERLMARAYRRPVSTEDIAHLEQVLNNFEALVQTHSSDPSVFEVDRLRVVTVIRTVLIDPDFVLLVEKGDEEGGVQIASEYEIASRLSYLLVGEPPDEALRNAADANELSEPDNRVEHAQRLLQSSKGTERVEQVIVGWLGVNETIAEPESIQALSHFIRDWFSEDAPLSDFYEAPIPVAHTDGTSTEEPLGVMGMDGFLGSHTFPPTPAFITRGVFVVERLLCAELPADVPAEALESDAVRTDVEVFENHARQPCATCHTIFDNYGAALHQFDGASGLYESGPTELGSGFELFDLGGISGVVDGPQDLSGVMAASERAPRCMAELWYRGAMRRSLDPQRDDERVVDVLIDNWNDTGDTSLRSLLLSLVASEQFVAFVP